MNTNGMHWEAETQILWRAYMDLAEARKASLISDKEGIYIFGFDIQRPVDLPVYRPYFDELAIHAVLLLFVILVAIGWRDWK